MALPKALTTPSRLSGPLGVPPVYSLTSNPPAFSSSAVRIDALRATALGSSLLSFAGSMVVEVVDEAGAVVAVVAFVVAAAVVVVADFLPQAATATVNISTEKKKRRRIKASLTVSPPAVPYTSLQWKGGSSVSRTNTASPARSAAKGASHPTRWPAT